MATKKIIFISQEITPYLGSGQNAAIGRSLPQSMQQLKYEVRTFMPDFGDINERRNQLHEVIRLSGMNIVIGDNDHPLVVKVASMQPSRIQVYFIDNDDYFQRLQTDADSFGSNREDNDERMIFFARGTMETARKLRWEPDVIQVSGWMSALIPLYVKTLFSDGPSFHRSKLVYSIFPENEVKVISSEFFNKLIAEGVAEGDLEEFKDMELSHKLFHKMAIRHSDAVVFHGVEPSEELTAYCEAHNIPWRKVDIDDDHAADYDTLYTSLRGEEE